MYNTIYLDESYKNNVKQKKEYILYVYCMIIKVQAFSKPISSVENLNSGGLCRGSD